MKKSDPPTNTPRPKSGATRQAELRLRRAEEGCTEVRGIFAPPDQHAMIKEYAKSLQDPAQSGISTSSS